MVKYTMRFGFYTLGCKVNQYETQAMEQLLAARQPFEVRVGNINAKHLMGMICLDYSRPLNVQADCPPDEGAAFYKDAIALQA